MDSSRRSLPLAAPPLPTRLDAQAAAQLGLVQRGPARVDGLVDRFGRAHRTLRISVTERCNLRCRYCMPEEGVPLLPREALLTFEEIERLARLFVQLDPAHPADRGEPLVRKDLVGLAGRLGALKNNSSHSDERPAAPAAWMSCSSPPMDSARAALPELLAAGLDGE